MLETTRFDAAEHLKTAEEVSAYLNIVLEEKNPASFMRALGTVARSEGMTEVARRAGVSRENLYDALTDEGNPRISTVMKVLEACGIMLVTTPIQKGKLVTA